VVDRNIAFADNTRQPVAAGRRNELVQPTVCDVHVNISHHPPSKTPGRGKVPVFYHCGKSGHIRRNCFAKRYSRRKLLAVVANRSRLSGRNKKIMGIVSGLPPSIEAQIGILHLPVLIDSGSARSLLSFRQYEQLNQGGPSIELSSTGVFCVAASGHSLEIVGEVKVTVKIQGFSWPWVFLVSRRLQGQPKLGVDFIAKTKTVLDIGRKQCYFGFAPQVKISLVKQKGPVRCAQTTPLSSAFPKVKCGKLNVHQRSKLETLIYK
jgi:hypothetical protein